MSDDSASIEYEVRLTPLALEMLMDVKDRREQQKLRDRNWEALANRVDAAIAAEDSLAGKLIRVVRPATP